MIKLVLDMGLPRTAVVELRERGFVVEHVADIGMACAADEEILAYAIDCNAVVITLDNDFARLVTLPHYAKPSLIHIRIARVTRDLLIEIVSNLVPSIENELVAGAVVSVNERGARIHKLPVM
ncbi:MAG: DUF5615 family PIN-like protein [Deltaproteobacteria bacterium]|nr:DUF5615 family PIN-like protein [Deltaproteobacteria bacterium]